MSHHIILKDLNDFISDNKVYVPSDDEGNSYQEASRVTLQEKLVHKSDIDSYRLDSSEVYEPTDMEDYKDEMEDFVKVYVMYY